MDDKKRGREVGGDGEVMIRATTTAGVLVAARSKFQLWRMIGRGIWRGNRKGTKRFD